MRCLFFGRVLRFDASAALKRSFLAFSKGSSIICGESPVAAQRVHAAIEGRPRHHRKTVGNPHLRSFAEERFNLAGQP